MSDWESVKSLTTHGFASGPDDAAVRAVNAGVDMEMTSHNMRDGLPAAVKDGRGEAGDDRCAAVREILLAKYRMGLFEQPICGRGAGEERDGNAGAAGGRRGRSR